MSFPSAFRQLSLLGVGYIGGSAALAARQAGLVQHVVGYDVHSEACVAARARGVLDAGADTLAEAVEDADLVLLAAPVRALENLLRELAGRLAPDAVVLDVGSVKASLVAAAQTALPSGQFVGCHPMAGAEFCGVEAADPGIFTGRVCFVCPAPGLAPRALAVAERFWTGVGCRVVSIDPQTHDRLMAAQSHLPHVAAYALAGALLPSLPFLDGAPGEASPTTSLRDTTRIAASNPAVWRDIFLANAEHLLPLIEELEIAVRDLKAAVAKGDAQGLETLLAKAQSARQRLVRA